jgi:stress-induced morphogen
LIDHLAVCFGRSETHQEMKSVCHRHRHINRGLDDMLASKLYAFNGTSGVRFLRGFVI